MAVVIRMKRTGRRNRPCYRISVSDKRAPRDGRTLDMLGLYDPASPMKEKQVTLNVERAKDWIIRGAIPSETVRSILKANGVYDGIVRKPSRKRPGRKVKTKTRVLRDARKSARLVAKSTRRTERVAQKKAAAAASAPAE